MARSRPQQLGALTGLRFLAAFHVVLFHLLSDLVPFEWARAFVRNGFSAVSLFFVLSGFVLTYIYGDTLGNGAGTRRAFWRARAIRIYPLYALLVLIEIPLSILGARASGKVALSVATAHLALLQPWLPAYVAPGNVPGWSVGAEAFFYLLFPWFAVGLFRSERRAVLVLGMAVTWLLGLLAADSAFLANAGEGTVEMVRFSPLARCPEFIFGIGLGRLFALNRRQGRLGSGTVPGAFAMATLLVVLSTPEESVPLAFLHNGAFAPLYGLLIYGLASGGPLARPFASAPLVRLGEASYALYLIQDPAYHLLEALDVAPAGLGARAAFAGVLVVLSLAVHAGVERPLSRWLTALAGRDSARRARADSRSDLSWLVIPVMVAVPLAAVAYAAPGAGTAKRPILLGAEPHPLVQESGFYDQEWEGTAPYRWTNGAAVLRIPVGEVAPRAVRVRLQGGNPHGTDVRVLVNGEARFIGRLPSTERGDWAATVPVSDVQPGAVVEVAVESSTFRPRAESPGETDVRTLGVRVLGIGLE